MKISQKIKAVALQLKDTAMGNTNKEAEILVKSALSIDTLDIYINDSELTEEQNNKIDAFLLRRQSGEPMQYIMGETTFFGLNISVGKGVLIPRPETEFMTEQAIEHLKEKGFDKSSPLSILDLCTGSGCIALALALHFPKAIIIASDISISALCYAKKNALRNNRGNVFFVAGDLFSPFKDKPFHLIISNPPYIRTSEISQLQREIKEHEPIIALDGGEEGVDFYHKIFDNTIKFIHNRGSVIIELGYDQSNKVKTIAQGVGFKNISVIKDYSGIDRVMIAYN